MCILWRLYAQRNYKIEFVLKKIATQKYANLNNNNNVGFLWIRSLLVRLQKEGKRKKIKVKLTKPYQTKSSQM